LNRLIIVDSREKPKAIGKIIDYFDKNGIKYETSKLLFGDYMDYNRPGLVIDRKQNIAELAKNCTVEHDRFKRELERVKEAGAELVILVEQESYTDRGQRIRVRTIEDLIRWSSQYSMIRGEKVFRVLSSWAYKYPIRVEFCKKQYTGREIIKILYEG
jgi:ERCC4-type nuclease